MRVGRRLAAGAESPLSVGDACRPLVARAAPSDHSSEANGSGAHSSSSLPTTRPAMAFSTASVPAGAEERAGAHASTSAAAAAGPSAHSRAAGGGSSARARRGGGGTGAGGGRAAAAPAGGEQELRCRLLIDCMVTALEPTLDLTLSPAGGEQELRCRLLIDCMVTAPPVGARNVAACSAKRRRAKESVACVHGFTTVPVELARLP